MMLAADLTTYYNRVRRHLDCPKDEQNRLLLGVNKQVIELQADAPIVLPKKEAPSSYRSYSFCCCFNRCLVYFLSLLYSSQVKCSNCEKRFSNLLQHSR